MNIKNLLKDITDKDYNKKLLHIWSNINKAIKEKKYEDINKIKKETTKFITKFDEVDDNVKINISDSFSYMTDDFYTYNLILYLNNQIEALSETNNTLEDIIKEFLIVTSPIYPEKEIQKLVKYLFESNKDYIMEIFDSYLDKNKQSEDENMEMIISTVFPFVILPFFMLSIFLIQTIGAEVNDEKQTRGMEIIISNVSPTTHFMSKIISGNAFVIMQAIMLFLYSIIGILIRKGINIGSSNIENKIIEVINNVSTTEFMNNLVYIIPLTLILMLLTLIAYSLVAAVLASMTTNSEDFGQLQSPIIIISLIGYYLSMIAGMFKGSIFIRILSYVPFISAILSPSLLVLNQINIIDIIISISIMILTNFLIIKYGIKIYKAGILNYSSKNLWKKMFKAIKN